MTVFGRPFVNGLPYAIRPLSVLSCLSVTLVYCGQTVVWIKILLGMEVGLGKGHIMLDGYPAPPPKKRGTAACSPPIFGPCLLWPNDRPSQQLLSSCYVVFRHVDLSLTRFRGSGHYHATALFTTSKHCGQSASELIHYSPPVTKNCGCKSFIFYSSSVINLEQLVAMQSHVTGRSSPQLAVYLRAIALT